MRIRMLLDRLRREQDGIAIPTTMIVTSIGFAFVTVALVSSVNAQQGTIRDQDSKAALAAADAAANLALLRSNRYLTGAVQCVYPSSTSPTAPLVTGNATAGWCPPVSGTVGSATWTYQQSAAIASNGFGQETTIVATGSSDGVTRRIEVTTRPESGANILGEDRIATTSYINLSGNPTLHTNVGTNGDVFFSGNAGVCGNIRTGIGDTVEGENRCPGYETYEGDKPLPPLSESFRQMLKASNSNCQLARTCSPPVSYSRSGSFWNATSRTLTVGSNADLTMPTGDYFICKLVGNSNGSLIMPAGSFVRIFFDKPEDCGLPSGSKQIDLAGGFDIDSTGYDPETQTGTLPGFYLFGSTTRTTYADFGGGATANEFVFYGPYTLVTMRGNVDYVGAFGALGVEVTGNPEITSFANLDLTSIPTELTWRRDQYIECLPGSDPSVGC